MHSHQINLGKEEGCGNCVHEFFCIDYDKSMQMIKQLSTCKLSYQRMFIIMYAAVATIVLAVLRLPGKSIAEQVINDIGLNQIFGSIFVGTSVLGYLIVKNLASARVSIMFFVSSIRKIRKIYTECLELPKDYPRLMKVPVRSSKSADYQMIIVLSCFNAAYLIIGIALFLYNPDNIQLAFILASCFIGLIAYVFLHVYQIEVFMEKGGQKFSIEHNSENAISDSGSD